MDASGTRYLSRSAEMLEAKGKASWKPFPSLLRARTCCAAVALKGSVYVFAGYDERDAELTECESWTAAAGWHRIPDAPFGGKCVATVVNGVIHVGFTHEWDNSYAGIWTFDAEMQQWSDAPLLTTPGPVWGLCAAPGKCWL